MTIASERGQTTGRHRRSIGWLAGFGVVTAFMLVCPALRAASAADSAAAQALFDQAKHLLKEGKATEACPKLEESQRLDPGSGTLINLARCYEQTDRLASAWNKYLEAAAAAAASGNAQREKEARARAAALRPTLSELVIDVSPDTRATTGLEITRDGERVGSAQWGVSIPTDPGEHRIAASAPGHESWQGVVVVKGPGGKFTAVVPPLAPAGVAPPVAPNLPPEPPAATTTNHAHSKGGLGTQRTIALAAGGAGVVAVVVGTIFGLKSKADHDEAANYCDGNRCTDARGVEAGNAAYTAGTISTIAMIVGGVGLAAGATLWLTAPRAPTTVALNVTPAGVHLQGAF
jgi:serine/threonine-protein kinase